LAPGRRVPLIGDKGASLHVESPFPICRTASISRRERSGQREAFRRNRVDLPGDTSTNHGIARY
ncbi:MAG: hypothetical protein ACTSWM_06740, partial [Alphaproteobacteria bacterium]